MIRGEFVFDGIAIGDLAIDFKGSSVSFEATGSFVNTQSGKTHGWTKNRQWSPETMSKLAELRKSMEADMARLHLRGMGAAEPAQSMGEALSRAAPIEDGLLEHLGDGVPSV